MLVVFLLVAAELVRALFYGVAMVLIGFVIGVVYWAFVLPMHPSAEARDRLLAEAQRERLIAKLNEEIAERKRR